MDKIDPFLVLASAVSEGRISAEDFSVVCLPLFKGGSGKFPSEGQYQAENGLFYVAHDFCVDDECAEDPCINEDQVREAAGKIAERMEKLKALAE
ncbi:hypothetical protein [Nocardiopsis algeriensis]|uniref:Uncharacterized protein n=1 Tax=Nocardiopsis algeriensis TaxID=1478215 RepID=A0A841IHT9_9ACTN|nr:hypothetical protein [Nocardiopsis algeriensis]MBB6118319.1 hypothetical protein [Nocardiopsis algeriensis]